MCKYLLPILGLLFTSVLFTLHISSFQCFQLLQTVVYLLTTRVSLAVQMVKKLPAVQETQVQSLGWEDPLGEGNLQYSCLENSTDREAWWATGPGVEKSQTRLIG